MKMKFKSDEKKGKKIAKSIKVFIISHFCISMMLTYPFIYFTSKYEETFFKK